MRKEWNQYFLDIAEQVATRSTCDRLHVGCVIVNGKEIVSTGYNGSVSKLDHCDDVGHLYNQDGRCIRTIHAEQNALLKADRQELIGATLFTNFEPCEKCTQLIAQVGISRVVYRHPYPNKYNHHFNQNIEWVHLPKEGE